jgi:predicted acylesterase/phospholipase RssA
MEQSATGKELRIGLVLYGGVSLCIYIYGVVYEFLRLARGEGPYRDLAAEAKVKPVIDVISGTSAGGINGLFLAKALATGASLDPLKELWIHEGDLEGLIDVDHKEPLSLLDSGLFMQKILNALQKLSDDPNAKPPSSNLLDLFITATDLDGVERVLRDAAGKPMETREYGTQFHFRVRPGEYPFTGLQQHQAAALRNIGQTLAAAARPGQDDFAPQKGAGNGMSKDYFLAKVAAATASFPVAFAPVRFSKAEKREMDALFDSKFFAGTEQRDSVFGDGGMVDNYPFSHTIGTIFRRQADTEVDRKLFFVEPDPRKNKSRGHLADRAEVDGFDSLLGGMEAKLYESIGEDLKRLVERNDRILKVRGMIDFLEQGLEDFLKDHAGDLRGGLEAYPLHAAYQLIKLQRIRADLEQQLAAGAGLDQQLKQAIYELLQSQADTDPVSFLQDFDFPFRIRRLRCFIQRINHWYDEVPLSGEQSACLGRLKGNLYACIEYYYRGEREIRDGLGSVTQASLATVFGQLRAERRELMQSVNNKEVRQLVEELELCRKGLNLPDAGKAALLPDIYDAYEFIDMHTWPALVLADIGEADRIETVRISPDVAMRYLSGDETVAQKLAGEKLMHFSGFLKQSWRENDIIWGRLDAAEVIVRTLMPKPGNPEEISDEAKPYLEKICQEIIAEEMRGIRERRKAEIDKVLFSGAEQERIKAILEEKNGLDAQESESYFRAHYNVGQEALRDISRAYVIRTAATALRTAARLFKRLPGKAPKLIARAIQGPVRSLNWAANVVYFLAVTLKGYKNPTWMFIALGVALILALLLPRG